MHGENKMSKEKVKPDLEVKEILSNLSKSSIGMFYREYVKGDFKYVVNKPPLKRRAIAAVHIPTKKLFRYDTFFLCWEKMDKNLDYYIKEE